MLKLPLEPEVAVATVAPSAFLRRTALLFKAV
jgi:hypothetical protein